MQEVSRQCGKLKWAEVRKSPGQKDEECVYCIIFTHKLLCRQARCITCSCCQRYLQART